jgi:hypothetical protein
MLGLARAPAWIRRAAALALVGLAAIVASSATSSVAREIGSAPELRVIGFSPDGRYFAYEQYQDDEVSDAAIAAIDVIDRETGRSAAGFPFGFLGMSAKGRFPAPVGGHRIKIDDKLPGSKRLAALRAEIARQARPRLERLRIGMAGRRLAGFPVTARVDNAAQVDFALAPMLSGHGMRDMQIIYRATTRLAPADLGACGESMKAVDHRVLLKLETLDRAEGGKASAATEADTAWPAGERECADFVRITDIIAPPPADGEARSLMVLMLAVSWTENSQGARYLAAFVKLP